MTPLLSLLRTLRFRLWALALRARLRRAGGRLVLQAPGGTPRFHALPHVEVERLGGDGGTLTLILGRDCKLGRDLVLEVWAGADNRLELGDRVTLESWCRVQLQGGAVVLGSDVHVRDLCLLKSKSALTVGERTVLSRGVNVHATTGVTIGARCGIGERTSIIDSDHTHDGSDGFALDAPLRTGPIELGDNVLVSANCVLLRGATVGPNAVVGAGAVVRGGEYPGRSLVAGSPAEVVREL
jgi:acetyltransferase-like isoleucine patch superfamily enzyme